MGQERDALAFSFSRVPHFVRRLLTACSRPTSASIKVRCRRGDSPLVEWRFNEGNLLVAEVARNGGSLVISRTTSRVSPWRFLPRDCYYEEIASRMLVAPCTGTLLHSIRDTR